MQAKTGDVLVTVTRISAPPWETAAYDLTVNVL